MIHIQILLIWFIGSVVSYFVVRHFMIKLKESLRSKPLYTNSDMLFNIFISVLGSWVTMIMTTLVNINLINKDYSEWLEKKSKY